MHRSGGVPGRLIRSWVFGLLATATAACGGTSATQVSGPSGVPGGSTNRCETSLATAPPTVSADGGRLELPVVASRECAWSASVDASWAQIAPASGQGEATVVVTIAANPQGTPRSTAITLNGQRTTLAQSPAPCRFTLGSNGTQQPAAGGAASVQVSGTAGCSWTASSPVSWVSVSPGSGEPGVTATVRVDANGSAARTAQLFIAAVPFTVSQDAYVAPPPPAPQPGPSPTPTPPAPSPTPTPPTPPAPSPGPAPGPAPVPPPTPSPSPQCSFSIDPPLRTFDAKKHDGGVDVRATAGCAWTARSNTGWIEITQNATGTGARTVRYKVEKNESPLPRVGTLTIAGYTHTVMQGGDGKDKDDD